MRRRFMRPMQREYSSCGSGSRRKVFAPYRIAPASALMVRLVARMGNEYIWLQSLAERWRAGRVRIGGFRHVCGFGFAERPREAGLYFFYFSLIIIMAHSMSKDM